MRTILEVYESGGWPPYEPGELQMDRTSDPQLMDIRPTKAGYGAYRYRNEATGTEWSICRRGDADGWVFSRADGIEGGNDVFPSMKQAIYALREYLRGRRFDPRFGWVSEPLPPRQQAANFRSAHDTQRSD